MTKRWIVALAPLLAFAVFGQQVKEESTVINVEVPVRVFRGSGFVDHLSARDFEVFENGKRQKVEAVYLIKKRSIARREEEKEFKPETARNFYLFFEISDYFGQLDAALRYFIDEVLVPGDNIVLVTPLKTYRMLREAIASRPKSEILKQFRGILRRDVFAGASEYRSIVHDLEVLARALAEQISQIVRVNPQELASPESLLRADGLSSPETEARTVDDLLTQYANILGRLDDLRRVDQPAILDFTRYLKSTAGQKYVFIFYQREFVPKIDPRLLVQYMERFQDRPDIQQTISGLFDFYRRELSFDPEVIKQAFADSSLACHFLFLTPPPEAVVGIRMQEQSEDIYAAFREIARASGGYTESSANPTYLLKNAVAASENYYLLYYSPRNYVRDGKFKEIKVRVKEPDCRVVHRLGYFAR